MARNLVQSGTIKRSKSTPEVYIPCTVGLLFYSLWGKRIYFKIICPVETLGIDIRNLDLDNEELIVAGAAKITWLRGGLR